ncbi:M14 family metallopeptidase [Flavobacterium soli]|uniref:M14 family metallopeptidase n=1 Tax=Flavobacterium soli TaxID=344881 RepID=UPI000415DE8F|nr:M14 metallopeptidase family protein [Flavobacterium soli]
MDYEKIFSQNKQDKIKGRYITLEHIEPLLQKLNTNNQLQLIGKSVLEQPIYSYQIGNGKTKILLWSQMHGNESTTTKALIDFLNFLNSKSETANQLLEFFTFYSIPMLNPDGAKLYTRENANKVDLNRDSQNLTQPESNILRKIYEEFKPDFCYNLHDQRTIFGVSDTGKPATVSFLSPSYNEERAINEDRIKAINIIVRMNEVLQQYIPGQVGRFDDSFNINCIGDTFQSLGTPTILFEAGHFQGDYEREETRKFIFFALLSGFIAIYENVIVDNEIIDYINIPQNNPNFFDFVYRNVRINYDSSEIITNFAAQYKEELIDNKIFFNAFVVKIGDLEDNFGHFEYDAKEQMYSDSNKNIPNLNQKADFYLGKNVEIVNGLVKL